MQGGQGTVTGVPCSSPVCTSQDAASFESGQRPRVVAVEHASAPPMVGAPVMGTTPSGSIPVLAPVVQTFASTPSYGNPFVHSFRTTAGVGSQDGLDDYSCCENGCCCAENKCCNPAVTCCRCPPWYIVTAYVVLSISLFFNLIAMFVPWVSVSVQLDRTPYRYSTAVKKVFESANVDFVGGELLMSTHLERQGGKSLHNEHEVEIHGLNCEKIRAFYALSPKLSHQEQHKSFSTQYASAGALGYDPGNRFWPSDRAVLAVTHDCEHVKAGMAATVGAVLTVRYFTVFLNILAVILGGVLVYRCNPGCRRNGCHSTLPMIGKTLTALIVFTSFVNMVCFAYFADNFPDVSRKHHSTGDSVLFTMALPYLVSDLGFKGKGDVEEWTREMGGYGLTVFVWILHVLTLCFLIVAACQKSELTLVEVQAGIQVPKYGRWFRPEPENDSRDRPGAGHGGGGVDQFHRATAVPMYSHTFVPNRPVSSRS